MPVSRQGSPLTNYEINMRRLDAQTRWRSPVEKNDTMPGWGPGLGAATQAPKSKPKWERTPWWHWRRLLGQAWRLRDADSRLGFDIAYEYQTHGQRARNILEEQFNVRDEQQAPDWAHGNPSVTNSKGERLATANHGRGAFGSQAR